ncbi:hypothetical protein KP509_15G058600 [Ceratopteris richardii]|uniref:Uncharacterized protein n=1 Tax=Ceratopteris richardii TaxID=49495 RepID=A0A8T2T614_CERRI|nr:hypothetical protein KP509_15G058600 [Ceratopteris richardii]
MSAKILFAVNIVVLVLSIIVLGEGAWIPERHHDGCSSGLQWLVLSVGIFMLLLSFLGCTAVEAKSIRLSWLYIILLVNIILLFTVFSIFAFLLKVHGFSTFADIPPTFVRRDDCDQDFLLMFKRDWDIIATTSLVVLVILIFLIFLAISAFMHTIKWRVFSPGSLIRRITSRT